MVKFWAHSAEGRPPEQWHPLAAHLQSVAEHARAFADAFHAGEVARLAGLWHDIGKYSRAFQQRIASANGAQAHLEAQPGRVDHSTAGAKHAVSHLSQQDPGLARMLAYCVAGHHAGLPDWDTSSNGCLARRLFHTRPETEDALARAPLEIREQRAPSLPAFTPCDSVTGQAFQIGLFTRMLFSCVVDGDFLDTEAFMTPERSNHRNSSETGLDEMAHALSQHLAEKQAEAPSTDVNRHRRNILQACLDSACREPGIFSLTVPTGGGKTLSSLAFALNHARRHALCRVIYAMPFTSIVEQTADAFRECLGALADGSLLEHHSNLDPAGETPWSRLAAENWDAPLIVTTNVQLLESLFAARSSRCRKLHNVANSVIILDEAQALPVNLLTASLTVLAELVRNYGCSLLLCTATQPAIHRRDGFPIGLTGVHEIVEDPPALYTQMRRVSVSHAGHLSNQELAHRMAEQKQALCIVSTRKQARELYEQVKARETAFHLSASMCPAHRAEIIRDLKQRLAEGRSCRVVSTQLIEAGVDIDFPVVYRAMAGLDSIAQAAGRCNREGKTAAGHVCVFDSEQPPPPGHLRQTAETAAELVGLYDDLLSPAAIEHYFNLHYWKQKHLWDQRGLMDCFKLSRRGEPLCDFRKAADAYRLIDDDTAPVIIPWDAEGAAMIEQLRRHPLPGRDIRRAVQRYTVQLHVHLWEQMRRQGQLELVHEQYPVLTDSNLYSHDTGLSPHEGIVRKPEDNIT
ncbi:MAG: CRISPR-associated helicase Cas3' [bacterium]